MNFRSEYEFWEYSGVVIAIKSCQGSYLGVNPEKMGDLKLQKEVGKESLWKTEKENQHWQFKNELSGKYIRIKENGSIDVDGIGGPFCKFTVTGEDHKKKFQSVKFSDKWLAVVKGNVIAGKGGPFCVFETFQKGCPKSERMQ